MNAIIPSRRRTGFTLVEVLVVTGILAILFALATGVAIRALITANEAKVVAEMRQLESSVAAFKSTFGMGYMPSRIRLWADLHQYQNPAADAITKESKTILYTMFPRMAMPEAYTPALPPNTNVWKTFGWVTGDPPNGLYYDLYGPQCLVFFLGGHQGINGFSNDPRNPWKIGTSVKKGSFEFDTKRIVKLTWLDPNFPVYLDSLGNGNLATDQPYYYFSTKNGSDYSANDLITAGSVKIGPMRDTKGRFHNPNGFQLISAGRDQLVGQFIIPNTAPDPYVTWENGVFYPYPMQSSYSNLPNEPIDNLCNFHPAKMGIPQ